MRPYQRVNQVRTGANIEDGGLLWNDTLIAFGKEVGKVMYVVSAARHRWTEKAFRDIPVSYTVKMYSRALFSILTACGSAKLTEDSPAGV